MHELPPRTAAALAPLLLLAATAGRACADAPALTDEALVLQAVGRGGRSGFVADPVAAQALTGRWKAPKAGDQVPLPGGGAATWEKAAVGKDGWLTHDRLAGGYAFFAVRAEARCVMILEASGHSRVYVNGEPRVGDVYETGYVRLPIQLRAGTNDLLFHVGRTGRVRARLRSPAADAVLNPGDLLLPDLLVGEGEPVWGAVVVLNATDGPLGGLALRTRCAGADAITTLLPALPPLSLRKFGCRFRGPAHPAAGSCDAEIALLAGTRPLDTARVQLAVRRPDEVYKRTFVSDIDGSVQYYAVNPARPTCKDAAAPALFLTLHGAAVEATGQAAAYEAKTWGHLVAPTNRRPYGFDWEDWGRLDALEVLRHAKQHLHTDPQRTYLTGHSMGGHGVWHLGATYPAAFAAIGPSAGWISFWTYVGGPRPEPANPVEALLRRATSPSDTLALVHNYGLEGVYVLHGEKDDNVPVGQARAMRQRLAAFHHDFQYHEQPGAGHWWDASPEPGADCVDWAPLFDFFAHHVIPRPDAVRQVDFLTASPGVSSRCYWVAVEAQAEWMKPSAVHVRCDPGLRRITGTSENVTRLAFDLDQMPPGRPFGVELDGQKIDGVSWPERGARVWLKRAAGTWSVLPGPPPASLKGPDRCGPFRSAFANHMLFVYGTKGNEGENAAAFARARDDAETFWYRGNGSIEVVADTAFDPAKERDRNIVLYGNADTNAAWPALLGESPVQVRRGAVTVGGWQEKGDDLGCLLVRPRPGGDRASVGAVAGTGATGLRLTAALPYFSSGVAYPDWLVVGPEALTEGAAGVRGTGYFGVDWSLDAGQSAWRK